MKRWVSFLLTITMLLTAFIVPQTAASASSYNYAEALQKAIYFYECQQSGVLPGWNRAKQWRGDSCLNDYVQGGWYDAGDHVKFGLPMAYTASMLGWAMYEYGSGFTGAGQTDALKNNLKFVLDYFVNCDKGTSLVYQIGDPGPDHAWWGPVEVLEKRMTRPYYTGNGSCVVGQTAAALAIGSIVLNDSTYLTHAKSLFNLADTVRSDAGYTAASGFYTSWSGFWDELMWAATWLYIATGDSTYLAKAESYVPNLQRAGQDDPRIMFKWAHCWDDVHYGAILLLSRITGKQEYHDFMKLHLGWWTAGGADGKVTYTPGGLAWLDSWGSLRYATTEAFIASVYADSITDQTLKDRYNSFAKSQIDYALGSNPRNGSYEIGFGVNAPQHPHHRTSHGSWCDQQGTPANHRHILYGALVGGPDSSDGYTDVISNYTTNEVATDYNAGFVGILAKMCNLYGGTPLGNFPALETPEDEFFVEGAINSSGPDYTEIRARVNNRSGWPARVIKNLGFKYYLNLSEVFAAGRTLSDVKVSFSSSVATASPLTHDYGDVYYIQITFTDGTIVCPISQSAYYCDCTFRVSVPNGTTFWDPTNDWSYRGMTTTLTKTQYIPVYDGNNCIFGAYPVYSSAPPTVTPTATPSTATATPTPTPSTATATPTATPSTATPTPTPSTATATPTPTPSTATPTPTPSTATPTPTPSTATPTPTPSTATPTPTPSTATPTPGTVLRVQFFNGNTAATTNTIYPNFKVTNTGSAAISLSDVKVRYYFTNDGTQANSFACDYSTAGSGNVTSSFTTIAKTNADRYLEVGFATAAGNLAAGASVEVKARVWKSDWSNFTQTNDYSFNATATNYADSTTVTGWLAGSLKWGTEP